MLNEKGEIEWIERIVLGRSKRSPWMSAVPSPMPDSSVATAKRFAIACAPANRSRKRGKKGMSFENKT